MWHYDTETEANGAKWLPHNDAQVHNRWLQQGGKGAATELIWPLFANKVRTVGD